jgi:hypothetical protein
MAPKYSAIKITVVVAHVRPTWAGSILRTLHIIACSPPGEVETIVFYR